MRVNELAKEVGKSNKEIMEILNAKGANIKSHMSNVSEEQVALIKNIDKEPVKEAAKEADKKTKKVVLRPQNAQQHNKKNSDKPKKLMQQNKEEVKQIPKEISRADVAKAFEKSLGSSNKMTETKAETKVEDIRNIKQAEEKKEETKPEGIKIRENVYANLKPRENVYANMNQKPEQRRDNRSDNRSDNRNDNRSFNRDNNRNFGNRNDNRSDNRNDNRSFNRADNRNFTRGDNKNFANRDNRSDNRNDNRNFNRDNNRNFNRDNKPNFRNQNGFANDFAKDKDEDSKPIQSRKQNVKKPAAPAMDAPLAKKTSSTRINKNNFKNQKNDKKHRTEDGPAKGKVSKHPFIMPVKKEVEVVVEDIKEIVIPENITIKDFASKLKLQPATIVKKLFLKGQIVTLNSELTFEQAEELALEYDVICTLEEKVDVIAELLKESEEAEESLQKRPPVVCVMGHVDHGKTSLLDAIRHSNTTSHEAGGITQHIGAYMVSINDEPITFLDTPGHEAFTAMRMRGAKSTDIAILVVAADDGVMPQTIEAINHAKAAEVEIIVAINKVDKPSANIDRVKQELSEYELIPEDWGGSTIFCPVSAKTGEGISHLLEMIILAAEVKELKANADRKARGLVIEAELDKGKGPVATVLVQKGTLRVGDFVAAGACSGKVRAMMNDKGIRVKEAGPSTPVEILGLDNVPNAGEVFVATENDKEAKSFAATFISENKNKLLEETKAKISLDDLFSQIKAGNIKELPIIIKADVQGSVEAVKQSLVKLSNEEVQVKVIHGGVGAINESDVSLAAASNAIIIGFNVRPDVMAKATAEREKVDLRLYKVIYQAIEDVESAMKGMLEPIYEEKVIGHAEVRQIFKASGVGTIAGSYVLDGVFQRGCMARITRDGEQIFEGNLASLKRFKDDVKEVKAGYECGLVFEKFNDLQEFDQVEAYTMVEVERK